MAEFEFIEHIKHSIPLVDESHGCPGILGPGDDAAILGLPPQQQLVVSTDAFVESVHFLPDTPPEAIGHKALAVNLSDLAAMGARPAWFVMALSHPGLSAEWLERFSGAMGRLARRAGIGLAGGDLTRGPLNVSITVAGLVEPGKALKRSAAQEGDLVYVSGQPGRASRALDALLAGRDATAEDRQALDFPEPRLALGQSLVGLASACIDVSDGLAADLEHLLRASGVGADVDLQSLPASMEPHPLRAIAGGDDYELCFTAPAAESARLSALGKQLSLELNRIGRVTADPRLRLLDGSGCEMDLPARGHEHFASAKEVAHGA